MCGSAWPASQPRPSYTASATPNTRSYSPFKNVFCVGTNQRFRSSLASFLLGLLGVELPVAPLGPLRKCPHLVVLHISILTPVSFPPLCGRNQALSVVFEAAFETRHLLAFFKNGSRSFIFILVQILVCRLYWFAATQYCWVAHVKISRQPVGL